MTLHSRERGFTLVEVLIALTLLALIMLGLLSALRTLADGGERVEARTLQNDELRLVSRFLLHSIGSASPTIHVLADSNAGLLFAGGSVELVWLGSMPARHGAGGLARMRLAVFESGSVRILGLQFLPFDSRQPRVDWGAVEPQWLVEGVSHFKLQYQPIEGGEWRDQWSDANTLPGLVRILLSRDGRPWPDLVVPVRAALPGAR